MSDKPVPYNQLVRQIADIKRAVNTLVAHQFRLHPDMLNAAVSMQTEAYRLAHMNREMHEGKYTPRPLGVPAPRKDGKRDARRKNQLLPEPKARL